MIFVIFGTVVKNIPVLKTYRIDYPNYFLQADRNS
jgi:hypothetical protein